MLGAKGLLRLLLLVAALLVPLSAAPVTGAAPQGRLTLEEATRNLIATGVPGAVVLVRSGGKTMRIAAGVSRTDRRTRMSRGERFRVGSLTKSFVATVVLQLVDEHRLSLSDSVARWLPGVVPNGESITVRQLLNHTSGLFDYAADASFVSRLAADPNRHWDPRELVATAVSHSPDFAPGASWRYSNTNYILLGLIVEKVTKHSVAAELRRRVLVPLHLKATTFEEGSHLAGRVAHGYTTLSGMTFDATELDQSWAWTAGAIASTAADLANFYDALLRGRLLSRARLADMMKQTVAIDLAGRARYGLGLIKTKLPCGTYWGHDGGTFGYTSDAGVTGDGRDAFVVLVNRNQLTQRQTAALQRLIAAASCWRTP